MTTTVDEHSGAELLIEQRYLDTIRRQIQNWRRHYVCLRTGKDKNVGNLSSYSPSSRKIERYSTIGYDLVPKWIKSIQKVENFLKKYVHMALRT